MADQGGKAKLGLGHWVAMGGGALGILVLILQVILVLVGPKTAGLVIHSIVQALILIVLTAGVSLAVLMARRNSKMYTIALVLGAIAFLLAMGSALRLAPIAGWVTFYYLLTVLAAMAGGLLASGSLTLPKKSDLDTVTQTLHHEAAAPAPPAPAPEAPTTEEEKED